MPAAELVVLRFRAREEARHAAELPERGERLAPALVGEEPLARYRAEGRQHALVTDPTLHHLLPDHPIQAAAPTADAMTVAPANGNGSGLTVLVVDDDPTVHDLLAATLDKDADGNVIRKAGIMGVVLADGEVRPGDAIEVELPPEPRTPLEPV